MEGQRFRLKDLGSGNGSLVNGQRVDSVILNDGDQIEIGNTLMRFDHMASRPQAVAPPPQYAPPPGYPPPGYPQQPGPPGYAPPPGYPPANPGYPPGYPSASGGYPPPAPAPGYPQSQHPPPYSPPEPPPPQIANAGPAPSYVGPPAVPRIDLRKGPIRSTFGKIVLFGGLMAASMGGVIFIAKRRASAAHPAAYVGNAEELYRQGLRFFAAGDYEVAKTKFNEVVALAADAPEPRRYARLCDAELTARTSLKNAERALVNRRYVEAVRALDAVESTSIYYDQASRQRRDTAPKAAAELVEEARRLAADSPEEARSRLKTAMELDPSGVDPREVNGKIQAPSAAAPVTHTGDSTPTAANAAPTVSNSGSHRSSKESHHHTSSHDSPVASTHESSKEPEDAGSKPQKSGPAMAQPDSKAGLSAYKAREFQLAYKAYIQDSMRQNENQARKTIEYANQVRALQQTVEHATADENKQPGQAAKEYEQAIVLDQKLSKGIHAAYFKQRIGGLGVQAAKTAWSAGNYDQAFQAATLAHKGGSPEAAGILKQLDQKANEMITQGVALQKSNVGQAKQLWRGVLKMVPATSPTYTKAYSLLNNVSTPKRDEDED